MVQRLTEKVLKTVRNYEMIKPGDAVLACVSGGPDSIFLLHVLGGLKNKLGIRKIVVCNMDHGIRGAESIDDSVFVKKLTDSLDFEFYHRRIDLSRKTRGLSTEEFAREARYGFFAEAAKRSKANVVATGHTLDDQAETVLMRLIKGASLKGIVGISPVRKEKSVSFVRPLIEIEKNEIKRFLDDNRIEYRVDRTNFEDLYFRNVVRNKIIPYLETFNPRLKRALFNLAEHLREDFQFIDEKRAELSKAILKKRGKVVSIKLEDIAIQPKALQKEILRDGLENAGGEIKKLTFRHWKEMESLIRRKTKGAAIDLPGGIRITRTSRSLEFQRL